MPVLCVTVLLDRFSKGRGQTAIAMRRTGSMEYRTLPKTGEKISILGLGMGSIHEASVQETERTVLEAIDAGINIMDFIPSQANAFEGYVRALKHRRDKVMLQVHFGANYETGMYGWTTDVSIAKREFQARLDSLGTDYADFGFIHCIDEPKDFDAIMNGGIWDLALKLKQEGVVRHLAFSTHDVSIARKFIATGQMNWGMFSINPMYDYTNASEYGKAKASDRMQLYREFESAGVGIAVMKSFAGGQLLDAKLSPFGTALTRAQCIQYALDRPGVVTVLPGVRGLDDLHEILKYLDATPEERDYSVLSTLTPKSDQGVCVYCNHCQPCPTGLSIGLINKYYDLARMGDAMAADHYRELELHASDCISCGHCDERCPFGVHQSERMQEIADYFGE